MIALSRKFKVANKGPRTKTLLAQERAGGESKMRFPWRKRYPEKSLLAEQKTLGNKFNIL
jgi:hypothetical protein